VTSCSIAIKVSCFFEDGGLRVASRFLDELDPRGQPEFVVDVSEVSLHRARGHEEPGGDVLIAA
jgi:hypothetical protein